MITLKRLFILMLLLLSYQPESLSGHKKNKKTRKKQTTHHLKSTVQQKTVDDEVAIIEASDANTPPFEPGSFHDEINRSLFERLFKSRNVRGLAQEVIKNHTEDPTKPLGTGDLEETIALLSEALRSHVYHQEADEATTIINFSRDKKLQLDDQSVEDAEDFLQPQKAQGKPEGSSLAPLADEDANIQQKRVLLASVAEKIKEMHTQE